MRRNKIKKKFISKLEIIISGFVFFISGIVAWESGEEMFAIANFIVSIFNLTGLFTNLVKLKYFKILLLLFNSAMAFISAYSYHAIGKKGLPYIWLLVGIVFLVLVFTTYRKLNETNVTKFD